MKLKKCVGIFLFSTLCLNVGAIDHKGITFDRLATRTVFTTDGKTEWPMKYWWYEQEDVRCDDSGKESSE